MAGGNEMNPQKHVRWLYQELPELVSQGVVPAEVAERLRRHYGEPDALGGTAKKWAIVLFSILGAALIGGGIILLLAHNWEQLSRPMRAVISVTPLALAAVAGAWLLWTQRPSTAWREGVGTFQTLAIGVAIALIAQTYNLGGRFDEFMLTWSLLALLVAYLLGATVPALLYLVGITVWTGAAMYYEAERLAYFPLLGLALPYLWLTSRTNRYHPRPVWFAWGLAITVCIGTGLAASRVCDRLEAWPMLFGGLFALLFLVGARWWSEASASWQRPLQTVGALGVVGLALVLSFRDAWSRPSWGYYWDQAAMRGVVWELAVGAIFPVAAMALWVRSWTRRAWSEVIIGAVPALTVVGWVSAVYDATFIGAALFNLYLFTLGIGTLVIGLRERRLGTVNVGMFVLAAVILCRFFDSDLGFLLKGIAFILVGAGFLGTNWVLWRQKGAVRS
jgi:uncharacterized membrane protein